jgi:hypothetical protein
LKLVVGCQHIHSVHFVGLNACMLPIGCSCWHTELSLLTCVTQV